MRHFHGVRTTEFLFSLIALAVCAYAAWTGFVEHRDLLACAGVAGVALTAAGYSHSRGSAKAKPVNVGGGRL